MLTKSRKIRKNIKNIKNIKSRKISKNKKNIKNKKVNCWKSCKHVPCGKMMNHCPPMYCYPGGSKSWTKCNMKNWGKKYKHLSRYCSNDKCNKTKQTRVPKYQVLAKTLHKKMPYIWRFLKPQTRKQMILLAKKPTKKIDINHMIYSDKPN